MGLVLVATSERHGDLGFGCIEEDLTKFLRGQEGEIQPVCRRSWIQLFCPADSRWDLQLEGENVLTLSMLFTFYKPVSNETQSQSLLGE